jgi:hypothetical protein
MFDKAVSALLVALLIAALIGVAIAIGNPSPSYTSPSIDHGSVQRQDEPHPVAVER